MQIFFSAVVGGFARHNGNQVTFEVVTGCKELPNPVHHEQITKELGDFLVESCKLAASKEPRHYWLVVSHTISILP